MYQLNPLLFESKKQLLKRLSRYSPEQVSKIRSKMLSLGKENGGWYSANEYGKRMYNGQVKRASKLFKKYNFTPNMFTDDRPNKAGVNFGREFLTDKLSNDIKYVIPGMNDKLHSMSSVRNFRKLEPSKTKNSLIRFIKDNGYKKSMVKKVERYNKHIQSANRPLTNAHTATHETDELESLLRNYNKAKDSKRELNKFWNKVDMHLDAIKNPTIQTHNPNVLEREVKRNKLLSSMYGKEIAIRPRSHKEFNYNSGEYFK